MKNLLNSFMAPKIGVKLLDFLFIVESKSTETSRIGYKKVRMYRENVKVKLNPPT